MDKKVGKLVQDVMGKGEKMAPVKSMKLKVKFQKSDVEDKKKDILKDAVKKSKDEEKGEKKESKDEEKAEKDGMGGPSFGNNPGISKVGDNMTGQGGPSKLYKNLGKGGLEQTQGPGKINHFAKKMSGRGGLEQTQAQGKINNWGK